MCLFHLFFLSWLYCNIFSYLNEKMPTYMISVAQWATLLNKMLFSLQIFTDAIKPWVPRSRTRLPAFGTRGSTRVFAQSAGWVAMTSRSRKRQTKKRTNGVRKHGGAALSWITLYISTRRRLRLTTQSGWLNQARPLFGDLWPYISSSPPQVKKWDEQQESGSFAGKIWTVTSVSIHWTFPLPCI